MDILEPVNSIEKHMCEKATFNRIPINAIFELTPLCNMNCDMCFIRLNPEEMRKIGRYLSLEEWLVLAEDMQRAGTLFVTLTGGEPLLHPGFRGIYLGLKKLGMILTINTNGTLIDKEWVDFFAKNRPRRINVTLYGKDENAYEVLCHYPEGYVKTVNAIKLLRERGVDVKINGSLTPANAGDVDSIIQLADDLETAWKIDTYMYPISRERSNPFRQQARLSASKAAEYRVDFMRKKMGTERFCLFADQFLSTASGTSLGDEKPFPMACRAGRSSFAVNWKGHIRPCVLLPNPDIPLCEMGFEKAWQQLTKETDQIYLSSHCSVCTLRNVCNTCAACAFAESGSFDGIPEYMCRYTRETLNYLEESIRLKRHF